MRACIWKQDLSSRYSAYLGCLARPARIELGGPPAVLRSKEIYSDRRHALQKKAFVACKSIDETDQVIYTYTTVISNISRLSPTGVG